MNNKRSQFLRSCWRAVICCLAMVQAANVSGQTLLPGFARVPEFAEQIRWRRLPSGIRVCINAPLEFRAGRRRLVIYATPNGSTIEQTLGCAATKDVDFRFDIQHVAAQIRRWREVDPGQDVVLAVVEAPKLNWPTFSSGQPDAQQIIRELTASLTKEVAADRVVLAAHSGGGSFLWTCVESTTTLESIERILFLDANYSFAHERHRDNLLAWLRGDPERKLVVVAYDDREILLNGKKVVGPDGGTFRATHRMEKSFEQAAEWTEQMLGPFRHVSGLNGQIQFFVHPNPDNKILHTALVGEMNGLLHGLTVGTDHSADWGQFGGPRAYAKWIPAAPLVEFRAPRATILTDAPELRLKLPPRPADAPTGTPVRTENRAACTRRARSGHRRCDYQWKCARVSAAAGPGSSRLYGSRRREACRGLLRDIGLSGRRK